MGESQELKGFQLILEDRNKLIGVLKMQKSRFMETWISLDMVT